MASIFSLFGEIFIDNEKANASIEDTTKKGETAGSKVGSAFGTIAKGAADVGKAVISGASTLASSVFEMANNTATAADQIDKLSERTGINREELQRWKHAADQSGVNVDSFSNGIKKMSGILEDARSGNAKATESLEALGLSIQDFEGLSTEESFDKITAALADMEQGTERNSIGADLLGKTYTEMLPLLNAGSDGIAALKQEADDLGIVMSEDAVKAGVVFGDTLANVKDAAGGLMNQLGSALLPVLQVILDLILAHLPEIQEIMAKIVPIITSLFEEMLPPILELAEQLFPVLIDLIMQILPPCTEIISAILPVITELLQMLLPPILEIVEMVLPLLLSLIEPLLPLLQPILALLQPVIDLLMMIITPLIEIINEVLPPLITIISKVIEVAIIPLQAQLTTVAGIVGGTFTAAFDSIKNVIETAKNILSGLIDFVKNVFTGNWKGAWDSVVKIFSDIFTGIKEGFKIPINWVIDGINAFIKGLNKIQIPDWVPVVGGKGLNIAEIPRLRIGMEYVPYDDMPALLHKGEQVLTESEADEYRKSKSVLSSEESKQDVKFELKLMIDKFINSSDENLEELAEKLMVLIQELIRRKGVVFE